MRSSDEGLVEIGRGLRSQRLHPDLAVGSEMTRNNSFKCVVVVFHILPSGPAATFTLIIAASRLDAAEGQKMWIVSEIW